MTSEQLKNSILQFAVQGKLVPQNLKDEPASELLKKIKAEKEQLVNGKVIKRDKPLLPIKEEDKPFDIPESWEWVRLGDAFNLVMGQSPDGNSVTTNTKGMEFHQGKVFFTDKYINKSNQTTSEPSKIASPNSVLLCVRAPVGIVNITNRELCIGRGLCAIKPLAGISVNYIFYMLLTYKHIFVKQATGTTFVAVTGEIVKNQVIPLPPLAEQQRIVDKIEGLLPLVEQYGTAELELRKLNTKFPERLKKSVLQYAVQGKLVPQNLNDEPASILLEKIKAEKKQLIKDKIFKQDKPLLEIKEDEIPFEIPDSWVWCRLGDIANKLTDGTHYTPKYTEEGIPFLSVKDMSSGKLDFRSTRHISPEEHKILFSRCNPEIGDLLLTKVGTTGIPIIVDTDKEFSLFVSVALIKFNTKLINSKFLVHLINSPLVQNQCTNATRGVGNKNWVMRDIANTLIALPPLSEQKLIVEKVEEVLSYCDKLK